ncbi:MAG: pirin family protein [Myxococcales bacterium]|nr:pirin family protein [Myxococcales bacterium]
MGPAGSLAGREIGMDFAGKDGWRMYHGEVVPGFPRHPHRGFETVTIARRGFIDHSDSLGATARFGEGDVQWMTAGRGIVHSEMFPLVRRDRGNPLELFQIWLNLPRASKMVEPHFSMLWSGSIPRVRLDEVEVTAIAGAVAGATPPAPPPASWAADPRSEVAIWSIRAAPGARFVLPATPPGVDRTLYLFRGEGMGLGPHRLPPRCGLRLRQGVAIDMVNGPAESELLLLQGRPIGEPVAQHGPFVMNTAAEIERAFLDYRRTQFGGWPWASDGPVHAREAGRFAIHADGRREAPGGG